MGMKKRTPEEAARLAEVPPHEFLLGAVLDRCRTALTAEEPTQEQFQAAREWVQHLIFALDHRRGNWPDPEPLTPEDCLSMTSYAVDVVIDHTATEQLTVTLPAAVLDAITPYSLRLALRHATLDVLQGDSVDDLALILQPDLKRQGEGPRIVPDPE